jgi:hypothetical protein
VGGGVWKWEIECLGRGSTAIPPRYKRPAWRVTPDNPLKRCRSAILLLEYSSVKQKIVLWKKIQLSLRMSVFASLVAAWLFILPLRFSFSHSILEHPFPVRNV